MSTNSLRKLDQKEYLKKYLSGDKVKKKKNDKKHKKSSSSAKVKIIDDDVNHFDTGPQIDEELLLTGDDAPQIVGEYIEENAAESKLHKWRSIGIKEEPQDEWVSNANDEEELWGKKSESLKTKNVYSVAKKESVRTPGFSPPRRKVKKRGDSSPSPPGRRHNSPPQRKDKKCKSPHRRRNSDDISTDNRKKIKREPITPDKSPPRRRQVRENDSSPSRRQRNPSSAFSPKRDRRNNSTNLTPPRNKKYDNISSNRRENYNPSPPPRRNFDQTPPRNRNRSSDPSPPRKVIENSPDQSPQRKDRNQSTEQSPRRGKNYDQSPRKRTKRSPDNSPRRNRNYDKTSFRRGRNLSHDQSPPRKDRNLSPDSPPLPRKRENFNQSPPRKGRNHSPDQSPKRNRRSSDQSPLRKGRNRSGDRSPPRRKKNSDQSPPRRNRHFSPRQREFDSPPLSSRTDAAKHIKCENLSPDLSLPRSSRWGRQVSEKSLSPPPTHKPKPGKTLEGKKAGLQDAKSLHKESLERREHEDLLFKKMSSDISGRHAEVQVRSTGRKGRRAREAGEEDPEERKRKEEHEEKKKQLYDRWGKGLKQIEDHKNRLIEEAHESSKPLARYEDDEDLERHLKEQERAGDPMLEYMRQKHKKKEKQSGKPQIPRYEGPFPENRFGIRPGYRWDGVDRSNGYEKKYFSVQNEKRARQDEAYKYSVEDM